MEWTEETISRLRELWAEGYPTAEIGRRMGISKNSVVGKAHRLNLEARPSPIRREGDDPALHLPVKRPTTRPTLPPLAADSSSDAEAPSVSQVAAVPLPPAQAEAPRPRVVRSLPAPRPLRAHTCCWPLGDPGTRSFRFCDAAAMPNKPYCTDHAAVAYVKLRDRREDAVA